MNEVDYFHIFRSAVDLEGKNVLEVGGAVPSAVAELAKAKNWTAINISDRYGHKAEHPAWYHSKIMSVTKMDFPDNHFDAVFSSNCFEHVDDVGAAFREIFRVLKPGGIFFTVFGPIWSGPIGHHTWVQVDGILYHFNEQIFPPWGHLLYTRDEMGELLKTKYPQKAIDAMLTYAYDSKDVNRNVDAVYEMELKRHKFDPIIKHNITTGYDLSDELLVRFWERNPTVKDFRTTGFFWVLAKERKTVRQVVKAYVGTVFALFRRQFLSVLKK